MSCTYFFIGSKMFKHMNMGGGYQSLLHCFSAKLRFGVSSSKQCLHFRFLLLVTPGYYNTVQLLEAIALHLDSVSGKPCIWEELALCFLRLFSDKTADYEDCMSCTNGHRDEALGAFSKVSSFFFEGQARESWKVRCRWWMHHHFSQNAYASETLTGSHLFLKFMGRYTLN